jgi:hypothetical protein
MNLQINEADRQLKFKERNGEKWVNKCLLNGWVYGWLLNEYN